MVEKVCHRLFLPTPVSDRLQALAAKPGASKSAILADAAATWINRHNTFELDERFGTRLDRLSPLIARNERDRHVTFETRALLIRFELAVQAPPAENDQACRVIAAKRLKAFGTQVGRQVVVGQRTLKPTEQDR